MAQTNIQSDRAGESSSEKEPDMSRYRDYSSILGIAAQDIINESPIQELLFKTILPGLALRLDYGAILKRLLTERGIATKGVLHLGGHRGEEVLVYAGLGFRRIVFVEPDPKCFSDLKAVTELVEKTLRLGGQFLGVKDTPSIVAVNAAAGEKDGSETLYRTVFSPANSMLKPDSSKDWMQVADTIQVNTITVDHLMRDLGDDGAAKNFNVMRLNIQGAELHALKGAVQTLKSMDLVYVEINFDDRYRGSPTSGDLESFLGEHGFVPVERYRYSQQFEAVGDILFVRR
jgi:FkbM family methyltransferase